MYIISVSFHLCDSMQAIYPVAGDPRLHPYDVVLIEKLSLLHISE